MWTMNVGETRELQEQGNSEYVVYSMHSVQYVLWCHSAPSFSRLVYPTPRVSYEDYVGDT